MSQLSPSDQCRIYKQLDNDNPLKIGEDAYLIPSKWLQHWKYVVGYPNDEPTLEPVGPIDNTTLSKNGSLNPVLISGMDFEILTEPVYKKLVEWYTLVGPEFKVPVVSNERGEAVAVVKKKSVILVLVNPDGTRKEKKVLTHRYMKVSELIDIARKEFSIKPEIEIRLRDYFNNKISLLFAEDSFLNRYSVINDQQILVDYQISKDKWYSEGLSSKVTVRDSSSSRIVSRSTSYQNSIEENPIKGHPGTSGFNNLGNTCFFNSGTQCLMHTMPFIRHLLGTSWTKELNIENPLGTHGKLVNAFASLVKRDWQGETGLRPTELKHVIGQFASQFSGYGQQDSHELILFMLDGIHEDLNRCRQKKIVDAVTGDGTNDEETAVEAWKRHQMRNDSIIVDLFHAQLRSELICPKCHKKTVVFDPYAALSLPLKKMHVRTLKLTYVPYDFNQPYQKLKLELPKKATIDDITTEICKELGRNVNVVLGGRSYTSYTWEASSIKSEHADIYALEIPDKTKFYAICQVKIPLLSTTNYVRERDVTGPIAIPVSSADAELSEIESSFAERLSFLWSEEEREIDPKYLKDLDTKEIDRQVQANITSYYVEKAGCLQKSRTYEFVSSNTANIHLNKPNLSILLQHSADIEQSTNSTKDSGSIKLDDCFSFFSEAEVLDENNQWYCPHCKDFVCASKKMDVWSVPEILVIQLKRFSSSGFYTQKLDTYVDFPNEIDMSKYIVGPQKQENLKYRLYAVSEHIGGLGGGHYIAHAIVRPIESEPNTGEWYLFDDSHSSPSSPADAHSSRAYVLFYERV